MARFWKEPYSLERAMELGIHDGENVPFVGVSINECRDSNFRAWPQWIYYVEVCRFTFAFFSLEMIKEYLDFYSRKILPSSRFHGLSPFSMGPAASIGDGQTKFERLPMRLRRESQRKKVVKALESALRDFGSEE